MGFDRIAIVGLGLIGGSLAAAFKRKNVAARLLGVDQAEVLTQASERGLIDDGFAPEARAAALAEADLVILATPIRTILDLLREIGPELKPGALVTDVGSTKARVVATAREHLPPGVYFLGGHPMTGSEKSGVAHADPLLFENAAYVLTHEERVPEPRVQDLVELLQTVGARVLFLSPEAHDRIAAAVSHVPQILAVALMQFAAERNQREPHTLELAAGGFRDMTRIAASPYAVWADILATNRETILAALGDFQRQLQELHERLAVSGLREAFEDASQARASIPKDSRGFLQPHFDLTLVVEDKPGVIAQIAGVLAANHINIKDIEILKVREGDAGTLRLAFESEADRRRAKEVLSGELQITN